MGIRTRGFTKSSSQKSGDDGGEKKLFSLVQTTLESEENKQVNCGSEQEVKVFPKAEGSLLAARPETRAAQRGLVKSPLKLRTPVSMARLGGMKVAARKLKKHRKRNLFVQSATKILRSSIKSNKTRRAAAGRLEEKPRTNGTSVPSRVSTRTCVRRSSREGIPESPLRTVELIKRPLELREPATKLLYMASLGLYPRTGESDMTPIVVIKELNCSPGKKNGVRKSLELPLIPQYHRRFLDLANVDKQSISENIKPGGAKQVKKDNSRKSPPVNNPSEEDLKKPLSGRKTPMTNASPPPPAAETSKVVQGISLMESGKSNVQQQQQQQVRKKTPSPKSSAAGIDIANLLPLSKCNTLDLTITPALTKMSSFTQDAGKLSPNSNSKSLLKTNISPPLKQAKDNLPFSSLPLNLTASFATKVDAPKPATTESVLTSTCSVTQAMNLIMSNITILPASNPTASRKRVIPDVPSIKIEDTANSKNYTVHSSSFIGERNPPRKRQKTNKEKTPKFSLSQAVPTSTTVSANNFSLGDMFSQSTQSQSTDDQALNLCTKKVNMEALNTPILQLPPKLQMNSNINIQKEKLNGSKALNLIIPRPPPLLKAPLEVTNFGNCVQNMQPGLTVKPKAQPKKARKPRSNNNHLIQSNLQLQEALGMPVMQPLPPLPLLAKTEAAVHAKSLLKCMNGEENNCTRLEIGESLDSVKTMLSRLQTRIGPAVNGVRLITIE